MPRLLPEPTGHPSPEAAALIEQIRAMRRDRPIASGEDRLVLLRDLQHVFTAAVTEWEIEVAYAHGEVETGASVIDVADVTGMSKFVVRDRAEYGREHLPKDEQERLMAGALARRHRGPGRGARSDG